MGDPEASDGEGENASTAGGAFRHAEAAGDRRRLPEPGGHAEEGAKDVGGNAAREGGEAQICVQSG